MITCDPVIPRCLWASYWGIMGEAHLCFHHLMPRQSLLPTFSARDQMNSARTTMNYLINAEFEIRRTAGFTDQVAAAKVSVKDPVRHPSFICIHPLRLALFFSNSVCSLSVNSGYTGKWPACRRSQEKTSGPTHTNLQEEEGDG